MNYVGGNFRFNYPNFGTPDGFPDHTAHSGQIVKVIRRLSKEECENRQPMYEIQASDGWKGHAWKEELSKC